MNGDRTEDQTKGLTTEINSINLKETNHAVSSARRAYVSGYRVYEDTDTGQWYALVNVCHGTYQSGQHAGEMCLAATDAGFYTCSAHRKQEPEFTRE
jgi:hypothetical protein